MLHEISPLRFDNAYYPYAVRQGDILLRCQGDTILCKNDGSGLSYPVFDAEQMDASGLIYLFSIDDQRFFLSLKAVQAPEYSYKPLQALRGASPQHLSFAGVVGHHLYRWYRGRRHCGACGSLTEHDRIERMLLCPACGQREYPQIMPAVIVGVIDSDKLLLTKYADRSRPYWALVAGYTEIGETLEETVRREVLEETGLEVCDITYYKSQPWGFTGSLLAGFYARVKDSGRLCLNEQELSEAVFVSRNQIDVPYTGVALTNEMICRFRDEGEAVLAPTDDLRLFPYVPRA